MHEPLKPNKPLGWAFIGTSLAGIALARLLGCDAEAETQKPHAVAIEPARTLEVIAEEPTKYAANQTAAYSNFPAERGDFAKDNDLTLLGRMVFGEARGQPYEVKLAIACTAMNRLRAGKWGNTLREVILKPYQFSCFNKDDPNREKILNPLKNEQQEVWEECLKAAKEALAGKNDPSNNATHYHNCNKPPYWARGQTPVKVFGGTGRQTTRFYRLKH